MMQARHHQHCEGWRHLHFYEEAMPWERSTRRTKRPHDLHHGNDVPSEGVSVL
jgi:hypothetical protein